MTRPADLAILVTVSRLYYELGETQEAIAARLAIPRPQVSRLLKRARAEGVVEIRIVDRTERSGAIAGELATQLGLRAVHLAPTFAGSDELTRRRVGRLAAQVLLGAVRDGMTVGIGEGAAMAALAEGLDEVASPIAATVVPLSGGFWGALGGREPFRRIADALGATAHGLLAPGVLDDGATRDALCRHAGIRAVTERWAHLDIAVFGIGGPSWSEGGIGSEVVRELEGRRAVGEMLIAPFDIDGVFVGDMLRRRTITFDARELHRVATTIGIASGAAKVVPILGAIRTGGVRVLVTDAETASAVLRLAGTNGPRDSRDRAEATTR